MAMFLYKCDLCGRTSRQKDRFYSVYHTEQGIMEVHCYPCFLDRSFSTLTYVETVTEKYAMAHWVKKYYEKENGKIYVVGELSDNTFECSCPRWAHAKKVCTHILQVRLKLAEETPRVKLVLTEGVEKEEPRRISLGQESTCEK